MPVAVHSVQSQIGRIIRRYKRSVQTTQFSLQDILSFFRRRKILIVAPALLVTILCTIGAFMLKERYQSSATILVQRDDQLNPLLNLSTAFTLESEDRTKSFNEIIYSESVIQSLADSLGLVKPRSSEVEQQELLKTLKRNIVTDRPGKESFKVTYIDTDPLRAQRATTHLVNLFVQLKTKVDNQNFETAVKFFEAKAEELRKKYESNHRKVVSLTQKRVQETPLEQHALQGQIDDFDNRIREIDLHIEDLYRNQAVLRTFPDALKSERGKQALYDLQRSDAPYVDELRSILGRYEDLVQRYTDNYPDVRRLRVQMVELVQRMSRGMENEIPRQRKLRAELEQQRGRIVGQLRNTSVTERVDEAQESNYTIYRDLYDDMKIKIEQARTARDLGKKAKDRYVIIDPPRVPMSPSQPNKPLLISGGFGCGLLLGCLAAVVAELLDTRVRAPIDLQMYGKPIIAFISEGPYQHNS